MPKSDKKRSKSRSGFFGVKKSIRRNKYRADIHTRDKNNNKIYKYLGSYDTAEEAAEVYDKEAVKLRRPFSKLNYPKKAPKGYKPIKIPLRKNNTVGYRGVSNFRDSYRASIMVDGNALKLGLYETKKQAAIAYDREVFKQKLSTSLLNFPDMVHNLDVEPKRKKRILRSNNTVGYQGVSNVNKDGKPTGKFLAQIYNGRKTRLGTFKTALEAAHAYDEAAIKVGRRSHTLNFPD